jgi:hypothetical protein
VSTEPTEEPQETAEQKALDEDVREALDRIAKDDQDGLIQPEAVVEAARDPESPLHKYFEWDVERAAHGFRLAQARGLIVRFTLVKVDEGPKRVGYVNVTFNKGKSNERRGYVAVERAMADPDLYEQVVHDAEVVIVALRNKLSAFAQARGVVGKLDEAVAEIKEPKSQRTSGRKAA